MLKRNVSTLNDEAKKDFADNDALKEIIRNRNQTKLRRIMKFLINMKIDITRTELLTDPEKRRKFLEGIINQEMSNFLKKEIDKYRRKHLKSDYIGDIIEAKTKDSKLFRIIEWDKSWLYIDWVKEKILDAQENSDFNFFRRLGEAISKKPQTKKQRMPQEKEIREKREFILEFIEVYLMAIKVRNPNQQAIKAIEQIYIPLSREEWFPEEFLDKNYFIQYLKRHNIIE